MTVADKLKPAKKPVNVHKSIYIQQRQINKIAKYAQANELKESDLYRYAITALLEELKLSK